MNRPRPSSGRHRAAGGSGSARPVRVAAHAVALLACLAAWAWLVTAAIRFGVLVRDGMTEAWLPLAAAGVGAVACLVIGLLLGVRVADLLRRPARPRHRR